MEAPEDLRSLARNGLREIADRELKARGPRKNGGLLSGWAWRLFRGMSLEEFREISFEIGMLGQYGLDINDPQESHVLRALPGRAFSALQLICIMYAGLQRIEPGMDIRVDLGEEWGMAVRSEEMINCEISQKGNEDIKTSLRDRVIFPRFRSPRKA